MYVRMPLFFSFQLQVFGSVGDETPDLRIYHVNEAGIYKMRNKNNENKYTYNLKLTGPFVFNSLTRSAMIFHKSKADAVMTAGHREEREASEMNRVPWRHRQA